MINSGAPDELHCSFLLHRRPYLGGRQICEFFTHAFGRVAAVAPRRRAAPLEPFSALLISVRGRGELLQLTAMEQAPLAPLALRGTVSFCGLYLNELLLRVLPLHEPHPSLFKCYERALQALARLTDHHQAEPTLREFELDLLDELGLGLGLDTAADGAPLEPDAHYAVVLEEGLRKVAVAVDARALIFPGRHFLAMAAREFHDPEVLRAAKFLTRANLAPLLGPRPLKSRELFL